MASKCMICKKPLPEGSKLHLCEFHKGLAKDNAKKAAGGAAAVAAGVAVAARDKIGPVVVEKGVPIAREAVKLILRR